ncbi:glycosyltransferase family 2 protein [Vibrio breoganii]|uniref:glycosyltransferase family 2 protein n=1 Tax=Vibrio breoganii TaxID=553239 RepID=UPI000C86769D|nr:glycosyltransferase [Vibrio breoganii]PMO31942.1 hypothetical protein BCT12_17085 [Vibrio breoganii]
MLDIKCVKIKTEEEIRSLWCDKNTVDVSIVCTTFNHESYIEDAIIGFLMQETNFAFEIIIHDDASTDKTVERIKYYSALYPNIIRPIYQTENQYSKGAFKATPYAATFAKGRYVAICEGDDYWCCSNKLQIQYDSLNDNKDIHLCVHPAYNLFSDGSTSLMGKHCQSKTILSCANFIEGDGGYVPTPSLFIRKESIATIPLWVYQAPVFDYYIQILSSFPNGAIYLPQIMCVYRRNAIGSWTSRNMNDYEKMAKLRLELLNSNQSCNAELKSLKLYSSFLIADYSNFHKYISSIKKSSATYVYLKCLLKGFQVKFTLYPFIIMYRKLLRFIYRYT